MKQLQELPRGIDIAVSRRKDPIAKPMRQICVKQAVRGFCDEVIKTGVRKSATQMLRKAASSRNHAIRSRNLEWHVRHRVKPGRVGNSRLIFPELPVGQSDIGMTRAHFGPRATAMI